MRSEKKYNHLRLLVNTSKLRFGGAVQVALSFIQECRQFSQHEYHVVLGPGVGALLDPVEFPSNFHFHHKAFGVVRLRTLRRIQREMATIEERVRPDCVITTSGPPFWRSRAPHVVGFNRPLFIYPESPYLHGLPAAKKARLLAQRWLHTRYFRRDADAIIVQTDDVNERVRRLLGTERVYTVTNTHSAFYDRLPDRPAELPARSEGAFRFLTVTSYYPHKNLDLIPKVIRALPEPVRSRVEFVLTLTEEEFRERISREIPHQVRLIGPVPPPEAPALYRECDAMFLPTLAECFSASYPEAMRMEKPIITSDLGFARSICEDAAMYFTPSDPQEAASQIVRLIDDPALQRSLRERGRKRLSAFDTPLQRTEKILSICETLVAGHRAGHTERGALK